MTSQGVLIFISVTPMYTDLTPISVVLYYFYTYHPYSYVPLQESVTFMPVVQITKIDYFYMNPFQPRPQESRGVTTPGVIF